MFALRNIKSIDRQYFYLLFSISIVRTLLNFFYVKLQFTLTSCFSIALLVLQTLISSMTLKVNFLLLLLIFMHLQDGAELSMGGIQKY
jgi:hypothetical protein